MRKVQRSWNSTLRRTPFRAKPKERAVKVTSWRPPVDTRPAAGSPRKRGVPPEIRRRVIERDGGCVAVRLVTHSCWGRIDPHHVWRDGAGGPAEMWNLIAVCRSAHDWIHTHPAEAIRLGLLSQSSLGEYGSRQAAERRDRRTL